MKVEPIVRQGKQILPMFSVLFLCLSLVVAVRVIADSDSLVPAMVTGWLSRFGLAGWLTITLAAGVAMVFGFPRQVVAFYFGSLLGAAGGVALSLVACCLSCIGGFWIARRFLSHWVKRRFPHLFRQLKPVMDARPYSATLAIRLFPVGSNALTNLVAGVTPVSGSAFLLASAAGYLPQLVVFALLGAGIEQVSAWQFSVSLILFAVSVGLSAYIYHWYHASIVPASRSQM